MTPAPDSQNGQVAEAEQALFGDTLVATESLPVRLVVGSELDSAHLQARAEWLLRTLGQIESGAIDHDEEHPDPALRRVEAKLDLTLDLLSSVLQTSRPLPEETRLRWSHLGVSFVSSVDMSTHAQAVLHLYLRPWLPTPLALPVRLLAQQAESTGARLWLAFELEHPGLQRALDKLLFRQHRRHVAQTRRESHE
jgi:hypothetical protein